MERKEAGSVNKAGMLEREKNKVEEDVGNALKKGIEEKENDVEGSLCHVESKVKLGQEGKIEAQLDDGQELTAEIGLGSGPNRAARTRY
ncbi:hypothetical protein ACSQ67_016444 [Phaseolus vulgaris]